MKGIGENNIDDLKAGIKGDIHRMCFTARIAVDEGRITEEEIRAFIAEEGNKEINKVFEMDEPVFMLHCLKELLQSTMELSGVIGGEND